MVPGNYMHKTFQGASLRKVATIMGDNCLSQYGTLLDDTNVLKVTTLSHKNTK